MSLAVLEFKVALLAIGINEIILSVGLETIAALCHHDEAAVITKMKRVVQQGCLNVVGGMLLIRNHIEDTCGVELIGHEVLILAL